MRRLKSETCVSKEAPCVRWYSQVCCNVVALQGQMKINVLPLPISASTSSVLPLLDSSGSPKKVSVWCWQSSAKVYCMHACCVLLSIALQGQIRLQAASSHWEKVSLVFGFHSLSDFLKGWVMLILWLISCSHLQTKTEYIQNCFVVCY